jgi:hypothetical protein
MKMIDIAKVREALKSKYTGYGDNGNMLLCYNDEQRNIVKDILTELERLQKRQEQFKNSKYVVIQDSVAKGFEYNDIKEAVDKLYLLKGNHEYDMGVLACVGGEQVFMIAERKLDWSDEK